MNKKIEVPADMEYLDDVMDALHGILSDEHVDEELVMKMELAVEEMYTNIANYAYKDGKGNAEVNCVLSDDPREATIVFSDCGVPYNPLERTDPDVTLSAEERPIGGLGVFLTKKLMDSVSYEYKDGKNILTIKKRV